MGAAGDRLVTAGAAALGAGDTETAERLLREAITANPGNTAAWRALAECQTGARRAICLLWVVDAEARLSTLTPTGTGRPRSICRCSRRMRLPWYEVGPLPGMDATISLGGPDLKFRNNTGAHILLRVRTDLQQKR